MMRPCLCAMAGIVSVASAQARPSGTIVTSNMNDSSATVIDAASGRVVATLPTGVAPHEVAISRNGRWALVSNYGVRGRPGSTLTMIDLARRAVVRTIDLQSYQRPHGMAFLPGDTLVAVTSEAAKAILLLDVRTGAVTRTLPSNGRTTHMVAAASDGRTMVTSNITDGTITLLHPLTAGDTAVLIHVAAQPEGIAITPNGGEAWVGSDKDSVVMVVDLWRRMVTDTLRGFGLPYRLAITPDGATAIITDPVKATIRMIDVKTRQERRRIAVPPDSLVATAEVAGSASPEGVTVSRDSRWAFVTLQGRNRVVAIDIAGGTILWSAPTGTWSDGVGFSPVRSTVP